LKRTPDSYGGIVDAKRDERACKVTYLGPAAEGRAQVAIEFKEPNPEFWHIQFPDKPAR